MLTSPLPAEKARLTQEANERWRAHAITELGDIEADTTPRRFADELRLNQAYYRRARGF